MRRIINWVEHRTGLETIVRDFLDEDIPGSSGWRQVLGSVALFCFMVQAVTGMLLLFNYAPTPGEAYNSVKYIVMELTGGRMIRNLHHWGASMMIIVVVLHMIQVFLWGAYKKPREATWIIGVFLLLITLGFGLTGYLLPWDNRAYWGTVVSTQIAASAPVLGPYLTRLLGADGGIGVVTFSRFFALHVMLLPAVLAVFIVAHVYLVRKHGVTPLPEETLPKMKFFPQQVFKDSMAIFVAFCALFAMSVAVQAPFGQLADPSNTSFIPRPDWYFLFLFQLLKLMTGPMELIGSLVLPNLAILALFIVPFLDRGTAQPLRRRGLAMAAVFGGAVVWTGLTVTAVATTPTTHEVSAEESAQQMASGAWAQLSPMELAGIGYYRKQGCENCHSMGAAANSKKLGPDLGNASKKTAAWMIAHFKQPGNMVPGTSMPSMQLSTAEMNGLASFLLKVTPANAKALSEAPQVAIDGAMVYQKSFCATCHRINNVGMQVGPDLNRLATRRERKWVEDHFLDPKKFSPGSVMPAYKFPPKDMEAITSYLMAIP